MNHFSSSQGALQTGQKKDEVIPLHTTHFWQCAHHVSLTVPSPELANTSTSSPPSVTSV